jgi:hypothetical protein
MTAMRASALLRIACALAALGLPGALAAQDAGDDGSAVAASDEGGVEDGAGDATGASAPSYRRPEIHPYIAAGQVLTQELAPGNDTVTYTTLAAGIDASIAGRNSAAAVSLRYERRFGYGDSAVDDDTISGVARVGVGLVEGVSLEAGGMAARTHIEANGSSNLGGLDGFDDASSQTYAAYAGPSVHTMAGDVEIEGHYRLGYAKVEAPDVVVAAPTPQRVDVFDESTTHAAYLRAGVAPDTVLPVGVGVGGGWTRQDVSNLDQRINDAFVRADVMVPVSPSVALVGGVGYEDVEISSRDALRDADGDPVIGPDGRYVTDKSAPRQIAYQTDGLIWDVGVMWRPSRRTALEAYVGHRYDSMNYRGSFSYAPNARSSFNLTVYDTISGYGGMLVDQLAALPAQFDAFRNPISGEIGGCVASLEGGNCIASALGSIRSAAFRSRGVAGSYAVDFGRVQAGVGMGYDQRKFIAAQGTVLASADGLTDETVWLAGYASTRLDARSNLSLNAYANWFQSEFDLSGDSIAYNVTLAYDREIARRLTGTAAIGLDGVVREDVPDFLSASGLLGLRYTFF